MTEVLQQRTMHLGILELSRQKVADLSRSRDRPARTSSGCAIRDARRSRIPADPRTAGPQDLRQPASTASR